MVVRYLDHAELRIARAIQAQLKLRTLLLEKRRVLAEDILLGRNSPGEHLIDSGVPWVGFIPESWETAPCRAYLRLHREAVKERSKDFELLSLTLKGVIIRDLSQMKGKFPSSFDSYQVVRPNDFVFCHFDVEETPRTVGLSAHLGMITGAYDVYRCDNDALRDYLYEFLLTVDAGKKMKPLYRGLRKTVPKSAFASLRLPIPPPEIAQSLVTTLRSQTTAIDQSLEAIDSNVRLLREYRTRLIADVVTGKKDVRVEAANLSEVDPLELAQVLSGASVIEDDVEEEVNADAD